MSNSVPVRFTKAWRTYFPGDVAGFDQETASTLIGGGVATAYAGTTAAAAFSAGPSSPAAKPGKKGSGKAAAGSKIEIVVPTVTDPLAGALNASGTDDSPPNESDGGEDDSQDNGTGDETPPDDQLGDDDEKP